VDRANRVEAEVRYNPWSDNTYKGMFKRTFKWGFGKLKNKKPKNDEVRAKRGDDVHVKIYQMGN